MSDTGYNVLSVAAHDGASAVFRKAYTNALAATGVGGRWRSTAVASGWDSVRFLNVVASGQAMPETLTGNFVSPTYFYNSTGTVLGGNTPMGDIRAEATGFLGIGTNDLNNFYSLPKNTDFSGALYAEYKKEGVVGSSVTGKVGIGSTVGDFSTSGFYEGPFKTKDINEFQINFPINSGNLNEIPTGSGVYTASTVTIINSVVGREGRILTNAAAVEADNFIESIKTSILDIEGNVVSSNYRISTSPAFTFSKTDNIGVFGSYTRNFGIRTEVLNTDGNSHISDFLLYGNTLSIEKVYATTSGGLQLNESTGNQTLNTGAIGSLADAQAAQRGFSQQQLNHSGVSGYIDLQLFFDQVPGTTLYDTVGVYASNTGSNLDILDQGNFLGTFPLDQTQGQHIRLYANDFGNYNQSHIDLDKDLFIKLRTASKVGIDTQDFLIGGENFRLASIPQGKEAFYALGNDLNVDDGQGGGTMFANFYSGSGVSGRMTDMFGNIYLISGEGGGGSSSCCTIEQTLTEGNTATTNLIMGGSSVIQINSYIQHQGDTNTYFGFPSDDTIVWYTSGTERAKITDDGDFYVNEDTLYVDRSTDRVGIGTDSPSSPMSIISQSSDDKCLDVYDHGDTSNAIVEVKGTANADGEIKVNSTDGAVSVKLSNESSRGAVEAYNAAGDTVQSKLAADANGGIISTKASDGTLSTEEGSDGNKRGFSKLYNAAGDAAKYVAEVDSNDQGSLTIKDSAGADGIKAELSSAREAAFRMQNAGSEKLVFNTKAGEQSYADLPKIVFGKTTPTSNAPFEVAYDKAVISATDSNVYSTGSVIIAGSGHVISGDFDFIGGGAINDIDGGDFGFIGGGSGHCITGSNYSSSVGGYNNDIYSTKAAFIGGGFNNLIESGGLVSAIAGGYSGIITDSNFGFVGGGARNHILSGSDGGVIVGGYGNKLDEASVYSVIGGGRVNTLSGRYSFVAGGLQNRLSGESSAILAGNHNEIQIADNALVAGNYSKVQNGHSGAFVFSDASSTEALSTGANALSMHFENGVYVESTSGLFINGNAVSTSETDTLQAVTDRGNTTTTSIISTGPHISGTTGLFQDGIGINTTDVSSSLTVSATGDSHAGGYGNNIKLNGSNFPSILFDANSNNDFLLGVDGNGFNIREAGSDARLTIDNDGQVGIGTNNPSKPLQVIGDIKSSAAIVASRAEISSDVRHAGDENTKLSFETDTIHLETDGSKRLTVDSDGNVGITGSVKGTGVGDRITLNGTGYLISGDVTTSELGLGTAATKDVGISNTNVLQANSTITDDDFLRVDGTQIEGRSASEVLSDIGAQASLTFGISNTNAVKIDSASVADDEYARFTSAGLESRSTSEIKSDIGLSSSDSPTFNGLTVTGAAGISGGANFIGTGVGNRITAENGKVYLVSGDITDTDTNTFVTGASFNTSDGVITLSRNDASTVTADLDGRFVLSSATGAAAPLNVGISNSNVLQANSTIVDNDFLRIDGTQVEGRSASEVLSDIGGQASLTFGISNTNAVKIDSASVADDEYARFTSAGLESRSTSEVKSDIGLSSDDSPTFNGLTVTGAAGISGGANFIGTGVGNRITAENGKVYLVSGDITDTDTNTFITGASFNTSDGVLTLSRNDAATVTTDLDGRFVLSSATGAAAPLNVGISNTNLLQANSSVIDNDFLRIDGTQVEGRSASEVLSDIGAQASLTFGISNTNAVKIDSASVADDEYARFTSAGLESRSTSEVVSDIGAVATGSTGLLANLSAVDADNVTVSNLEVDNLKAGVLDTDLSSVSSSNDTLASAKAIKSYVDSTVIPDTNTFVTGALFNTSDGVLTLSRNDASTVTTDLDGRFVLSSATGAAAPLNVGISNTNVIQANNTLVDNDFLRIDGTQVEGRSASEVLSDIGGQASLTFGISNTNAVKIDSASVADDEYARFTSAGLESRSTSEVKSDIGLSANDSPTFNGLTVTGAAGISGGANFIGTGIGNRITAENGKVYLVSGDVTTSELGLGTAATKDVGISNNNVIQANNTLVDNDFLRIDGTQVEGRSASEVLSDIGGQASLTFGIANTNAVKIDSADVADDEYARFTADGLESRSTSEVLSDIGAQASLTFGISNTNAVKIDSASVADDEYARFTSAGLEGRSTSELLGDLSLDTELQNLSSGEIDYLEALYATDVTSTEFDYLDGVSSNIQTQLDAKQASLTFGIANTNAVKIDSADVADDEYARFTANGLESRSTSEVLSDIGAQASLTFGISNTNAVKIDSASVADDEYARFTANGLESRSTSEVKSDIGLSSNDSPTFNGLKSTGAAGISGGANFIGTGIGNRITAENGKPYLISGDVTTSELGLGTAATKDVGISNNNVIQANNTLVDNDFLRIDGTQVEGRSASEVLSDIGGQASLTFGIANTNAVKIDSASVADDEYARFTANGLESRSTSEVRSDIGLGEAATLDTGISAGEVAVFTGSVVDNDFLRVDGTAIEGRSASEVLSDIGAQASLTFGISNTNAVKIDSASVADDEYARFTADGLESRSTSEVLSDIGGVADGGSPTFDSIYLQNTIYHDGDTDTRIDVSADTIQLATAGTTALTVASNSNVGIGTATPNNAYKLHTHGNAYATGQVIGGNLAGYNPPVNGLMVEGKAAVGYYSTSSTLGVYGNASVGTSYIGSAAPSNGLIVQGSVGIGTASPNAAYELHTHGRSYATGAVIGGSYAGQSPPENGLAIEGNTAIGYYTTSNNLGIYGSASVGTSYISTSAPSNGLIVQGNVGVGTQSPATALEVDGAIKGGVNVSDKSADFTLGSSDNGNFINGTSASFDQISISSDLGSDFNCSVMHPTSDVDIVASSSMIVNGVTNGTVTLASGYQPASVVRIASNSYAVFGNLL